MTATQLGLESLFSTTDFVIADRENGLDTHAGRLELPSVAVGATTFHRKAGPKLSS